MSTEIHTNVVVLGSGPAGYSAAFRCADLGLETVIIERHNTLGGVCLNVGCIPSKALLHIAKVIEEAQALSKHGVIFGKLKTDIDKIRAWQQQAVNQLTSGLSYMARERKIRIVYGIGKFTSTNTLEVKNDNDTIIVNFNYAIIATGSRPIKLPFVPYNDLRIWNSTDALKLKEIPNNMLVIGGGIIGLEISTIYHALGSKIDIVEMLDQVISIADKDIINIFMKHIDNKFNLMLETKVTAIEAKKDGIYVCIEGKKLPTTVQRYDIVLIAINRIPNSNDINIDKAGVKVDHDGFICVDKQLRTNVPHIFAIGDIVGQPMLAHKGIHEGHIAAEVIAGMKHYFDSKVIPCVVYTEPEIAWVGLTEKQAQVNNIAYDIANFQWSAFGRAIVSNCANGITKLIFDKNTRRIIGGAVVGNNGGEILGEISLAIEMGCDAADIALTIHAHPTLHESIKLAAEIFEGSITDLPNVKVKNSNII